LSKQRILVIEDERPLCERIAKILAYEGFEVRGAASGFAGVSLAHDFAPSVILCDLMLPELDGFAVIELLRQHLSTEAIPVVVVTALDDRRTQRTAMEKGADDVLTKPFTAEELVGAVAAQLRKQEVRARARCH